LTTGRNKRRKRFKRKENIQATSFRSVKRPDPGLAGGEDRKALKESMGHTIKGAASVRTGEE